MQKFITTAYLLGMAVFSQSMFGQVGINNTSPKATLDITPKTTDGSKPEGLLIPQLDGNSLNTTAYGTAQKGVIVYAKSAANPTDTKTINVTAEGYYYFDGSVWQKMTGASAGDTTNDAWVNDTSNGLVKLGTKADGTARTGGTDFVAKDNGQIGIGTSSPDASAALEVASTNKGMLIPRVALTGSTDQTTIPSPATGVMVYNTGASTLTYKGFVFWNGTEWRQIDNTTTINPAISSLNCNSGSAFPTIFTSGTPYSGTLTIPYTGGNGGSYPAGSSFSQNGLIFTLNSGTLNNGNGNITYSISGTPTFTSPNTISVPINFLGNNCSTIVGDTSSKFFIGEIRSARFVVSRNNFINNSGSRPIMNSKTTAATTSTNSAFDNTSLPEKQNAIIINGLRMDFLESANTNVYCRAKLFNTTSNTIKYSIGSLSTYGNYQAGGETSIFAGHYSYFIDSNDDMQCNVGNTPYVNSMIIFKDTDEWYNCTWFADRDSTSLDYYFYFTAQRLK